MKSNKISAYVASTLVLAVAVGFYSYSKLMLFGVKGERYPLHAQFLSANTIEPGGSVILAGVPIGIIRSIRLNNQTFMADVKIEINKDILLPKDSQLSIGSTSMTDDGSVMIKPGKSKEYFKPDDFITNTIPYTSVEQQISNYIFNSGNLSSK
ncbi:MlaD family protein [Commensalibacter oyaizuii]|uniref:MlaD family protein n=1 Tax=Commensalibacter oyaizuii TaxID=3043873 RepID=A0ABT6Q006_9PROT|nr:MlaD family protein [Commensalibacter sp. TBRC 16381]MDI2090310.1 MlaD family protein [Commensalibacter sp. TBRC 16381]